ncbi:MAG: hypothetical protein V8R75_15790 [Oscillospiraceae bacterium]
MAIKVNGKLVAGAGKSAYESAKDGGYTGTEDEFNTSLANSVTLDGGGVMSMNESFGAAPFTLTFTEDGENDVSASEITYDNTESGMTAANVQDAITELSTAPKGGASVPVGSVFWLATQTAPEGYLICDGSAVSRTEYATCLRRLEPRLGLAMEARPLPFQTCRRRLFVAPGLRMGTPPRSDRSRKQVGLDRHKLPLVPLRNRSILMVIWTKLKRGNQQAIT